MLKVAIAGVGTVGTGVVRLLQQNAGLIARRAGQDIQIVAVSDRDRNRPRGCDFSGIAWFDDARQLAAAPDIDVVVELIGGADGVARELAEATLATGRSLVTANKAMLALHGAALAALAEKHKTSLMFEASVGGGIPVIKALREGLAGNHVSLIRGILNGTCNYILTLMQSEGLGFDDALRQAQQKGYAEADPSADIDGHDTANKLALLAALAFGTPPDLASIAVEGIRRIAPLDLKLADELGYRIKLLGTAHARDGGVEQRVGPCLVPAEQPLAGVGGAMNAVLLRGDFVGDILLEGAGAGSEPTASAVVADIMDLARGTRIPAFGIPAAGLARLKPVPSAFKAKYYLRLQVMDKPGVVADIAAILRDEAISIQSFIQHGSSATESVAVVITTHAADAAAMRRAAGTIARLAVAAAPPCVLRIED
jgi:homoserine dehydrogenase